uniref:Uncharacterized protein n=1 Tax=Zea mays TaxID=4577 RepID=A0A804R1R6_MAIZE
MELRGRKQGRELDASWSRKPSREAETFTARCREVERAAAMGGSRRNLTAAMAEKELDGNERTSHGEQRLRATGFYPRAKAARRGRSKGRGAGRRNGCSPRPWAGELQAGTRVRRAI